MATKRPKTVPPQVPAGPSAMPDLGSLSPSSATGGSESASLVTMKEIGTAGLRRGGGIVLEEPMSELRGRNGVRKYRDMGDNSTVIAGALLLFKLLMRGVDYSVKPRDEKDGESVFLAEFCYNALADMDHPFDDTIGEALTMLQYGWAVCEEVYKYRLGDDPGPMLDDSGKPMMDPQTKLPIQQPSSKFNDGKLGWKRLPLRAHETLQQWRFDWNGGIMGMFQSDPWGGHGSLRYLPASKFLHFRTESVKNNPEGRSLLRAAYPSWKAVRGIMTAEAIGISRDIVGIPKAFLPPEAMVKNPKEPFIGLRETMERIVTAIAQNEEAALVLPAHFDKSGHPLCDIVLMSTTGTKLYDTNAIILRWHAEITTSMLMQWLLLGQGKSGSWALSSDQSDATLLCANSIAQTIADVFTTSAFPRLVGINGWPKDKAPIMKPVPIKKLPTLTELAQYLRAMGSVGAGLVEPGSALENALLARGDLPTSKPQEQV